MSPEILSIILSLILLLMVTAIILYLGSRKNLENNQLSKEIVYHFEEGMTTGNDLDGLVEFAKTHPTDYKI